MVSSVSCSSIILVFSHRILSLRIVSYIVSSHIIYYVLCSSLLFYCLETGDPDLSLMMARNRINFAIIHTENNTQVSGIWRS